MTACTMWNKNKFNLGGKYLGWLISIVLILVLWQVLSMIFPPLVVPPIRQVFTEILHILTSPDLSAAILITVKRLAIGLFLGVSLGIILGTAMGLSSLVKNTALPIIGIFQTVPPVSWVVLALMWFGFNGKPAIFIVLITSLPIIAINVCEGIQSIDEKLLEMAYLYRFSSYKKVRHLLLPSVFTYFKSALKITLGSGWKIAVMAEVLTTSDGIGGMIKLARLNIEPQSIIAWSVIIVVLFYCSDMLIDKLLSREGGQRC